MSAATMAARARKLRLARAGARAGGGPVVASPSALLTNALTAVGGAPDPWQLEVLESPGTRLLVVAARQTGKGSVAAARALHLAASRSGSLTLMVSASERQAKILLSRARAMLPYLGAAAAGAQDSQTDIRLRNGSRLIVLPASSTSLRGWTADLLLIDEAAFVPDAAWEAVVPTVASTGGAVVCLTSADAPKGWLYEIASRPDVYPEWERYTIRADEVARYDREFLEAERRRLPRARFEREYESKFTSTSDATFDAGAVARAFDGDEDGPGNDLLAGLDLTDVLMEVPGNG